MLGALRVGQLIGDLLQLHFEHANLLSLGLLSLLLSQLLLDGLELLSLLGQRLLFLLIALLLESDKLRLQVHVLLTVIISVIVGLGNTRLQFNYFNLLGCKLIAQHVQRRRFHLLFVLVKFSVGRFKL